ncbi:MAG: Glu/Leu/Phe/Val dehydrogenase dimerization domain-containing protein [Bacteroidota bacterium]
MKSLLKKYKETQPEIVFEWSDHLTDAKGWIVINSLRNGAAGGGTRMRKGLTKEEVISLAKVMEIKFSVCGPAIGGAKSGINFDPNDPRRNEVLKRWYKVAFPILKNYYGTGGDLNVDELKDVIPMTEELGLWHPQEGIVNGHLHSPKGERIKVLGQLRQGCAKIIENTNYVPEGEKYAVADMITGYGVAESVKHYYQVFRNSQLKDKKVIIQGWGNVASAAGWYLAKAGAKIIGIIDKNNGLIKKEGFTEEEAESLFIHKDGNKLDAAHALSFEKTNEQIWSLGADIFIPGAASKLVTREQVDAMLKAGLEVISCGANVPFIDDEVFFGETASYADMQVSLIPDFIANCGMARVFAYLMQSDAKVTDVAIFSDVSQTIRQALEAIYAQNPDEKNISTTALKMALEKLMD